MKKTSLLVLLLLSIIIAKSQEDSSTIRNYAPKIFLDCNSCDMQHIKNEISFVNYVRNSKVADIHILISQQRAGNGGSEYTFMFLGQQNFEGKNDTLKFVSLPDNTSSEIRDKQIKFLKMGLIQYVSHTKLIDLIDINYEKSQEPEVVVDKWNNWVFSANSSGWFRGESSYTNINVWSRIEANKVTEEWKIEFDLSNSFSEAKYIFPDETISSINRSYSGGAIVVKSFGEHWSAGITSNAGSSTFSNLDFYINSFPTVEYNIFPYSKSTIKQLTFRLSTGYKYSDYTDTTIYNKTSDLLPQSRLAIAYRINQKWGYINSTITGTTYLHDLTKNNLNLSTSFNIRIIKGLSVRLSGGGSLIHDQLNLKKDGASYEDALLRQQQLATAYSFWSSVGLSYTFGSVYNNIVNPRFN